MTSVKIALKGGAQIVIDDHPRYPAHVEELADETLMSLVQDLGNWDGHNPEPWDKLRNRYFSQLVVTA